MLNTMSPAKVKPRAAKAAAAPARLSEETIKDLAEVFKLLGDQSRLKILMALAEEGEMNVGDLCKVLVGPDGKPASQPAVSHHLSLMRANRLVSYRRDGKNNFYRIDAAQLGRLLEQFFGHAGGGPKQLHLEEFSLLYKRN